MTTIEDRLSRALGETAEARAVDVDRMRFELTSARITETPATADDGCCPRWPSRPWSW